MVQQPFSTSCSYPVRSSADLPFFIDGEEAFDAIASEIEKATRYVYVTCAYASLNFRMRPPLGEQLGDICARASKRGVHVALLFWQPGMLISGTVTQAEYDEHMPAAPAVMARWDVAKTIGVWPPRLGCHHQKTFVIDGKVAFVGGINMTQDYWDSCDHVFDDPRRVSYDVVAGPQRDSVVKTALPLHDVFARFTGDAVADVEANFIERWNGASNKHGVDDIAAHKVVHAPTGPTRVQVVRTIAPGTYAGMPNGERSIKEAMLNALNGAERSVYFENQYFFDDDVVAAVRAAGMRGVRVVGLLYAHPDAGQLVGSLEALLEEGSESLFHWTKKAPGLPGRVQLYSPATDGVVDPKDIYVHSKTMIVDDRYVLVGSANIAFTSMEFHSEMCVLVDDRAKALDLRRRLWAEHLCCAMTEVPRDFETGADRWADAGGRNEMDRGKRPMRSRVLPLRPPKVGDDVPSILDGGSSDDSIV